MQGLLRQTNGATLSHRGCASTLPDVNLPTGVYELAGDGLNVIYDNNGCCNTPVFNNYSLLRKSSGTGTATLGRLTNPAGEQPWAAPSRWDSGVLAIINSGLRAGQRGVDHRVERRGRRAVRPN